MPEQQRSVWSLKFGICHCYLLSNASRANHLISMSKETSISLIKASMYMLCFLFTSRRNFYEIGRGIHEECIFPSFISRTGSHIRLCTVNGFWITDVVHHLICDCAQWRPATEHDKLGCDNVWKCTVWSTINAIFGVSWKTDSRHWISEDIGSGRCTKTKGRLS